MGWSRRKNGRRKTDRADAQKEDGKWRRSRKTEIAMEDLIKSNKERLGEEWKKLYIEEIWECWQRT